MASLKLSEENELPINLEDLPNFKLKNSESDPLLAQQDEMATAKQFIKDLQTLLLAKKNPTAKDDLLNLYDFSFNKISATVFKSTAWPTPQEIEESDDTLEFEINTILLYQELCFRHQYARLNATFNQEIRVKSWENYLEIFRVIALDREEINLPVLWIYDILDEFLYQFQTGCQWRAKIKAEDSLYQEIINNPEAIFWNLEEIHAILRELIEKSQILKKKDDHFYLDDFGNNTRTIHYFGYFSLVTLLRLNILMGKYEEALQIIDPIDYKNLNIYCKAYACYINLFYYAGFAYLMTGRYQETVKIFEALLSFMNKYKQFYSK
jgi:translation initiation factor 3 subunit L